ncbi:DNA-binding LacI/PurR family transcriptional regulator [Kineococcus radiotolerans]|uniref:DNA-binding LacI/PurR family transcriptional regulator n=1 Tax=Kineococcus radiotolerans TaxID=131568 RepID=A0A7W4TRJ6_KINRA|nr:LacI family DNA-binding transcriptional regulator [Kineococcus radiotolerans]MBB2903403.1 DNA-binding LacI/PurR family transcriptional regulator [Kineococcus radiotolerans]
MDQDRTPRTPSGIEVARRAGVSQKTVSRVVNGEAYVSAAVREKVLAAMEELGYRPNLAARALTSGRSRRIGVVWLGSPLHGPSQALVALEHAARDLGYSVSLAASKGGDMLAAVESLLAQGVDGIVLDEPVDDHPLLALTTTVPVVSVGRVGTAPGADVEVETQDLAAGAAAATDHLLDLGHPTVHHVAGPEDWWSARDRAQGWRNALQRRKITVPDVIPGDWTAASGYAAGRTLLDRDDVTAVFCANDEMALGLIRSWVETGRSIPADLSVVGVDDIPVAAFTSPPLTTVRQNFELTATSAVARLVARIEGGSPVAPPTPSVPQLIVRASTAPPRGA